MSSSQLSQLSDGTEKGQSPPAYRSVKDLPYELREHCVIYFEEGLYLQALNLLISLITAGTSSSPNAPAFLPPPQHLALAATLVVHPTTTTRAPSGDHLQASNAALRLLRLTNRLFGPLNANFATAFAFSSPSRNRRGGGARRNRGDEDLSPAGAGEDLDAVSTGLATTGSLWVQAEDVWQAVGWAFNCSVLYPKRWARWKLWLDFLIEVLEDDWAERERTSESILLEDEDAQQSAEEVLEESLLVKYMPTSLSGYGGNRRIVRAIFADGSPKALNEFKEVFRNETKERAKKEPDVLTKRHEKVNIEEDFYADYQDEDEDSDPAVEGGAKRRKRSSSRRPSRHPSSKAASDDSDGSNNRRNNPESDDDMSDADSTSSPLPASDPTPNGSSELGDASALLLRHRLMFLLSTVSARLPNTFTNLEFLYDRYVEHMRVLPLTTFHLFITAPSARAEHAFFNAAAYSSILQILLRVLTGASTSPDLLPPTTTTTTPTTTTTENHKKKKRNLRNNSTPTSSTDPDHDHDQDHDTPTDELTQPKLERWYLPHAATSSSLTNNVRVSLVLETLMRLLLMHVGLTATPALERALEAGIRARREKIAGDGRRKTKVSSKGWEWRALMGSEGRLRAMVGLLKEMEVGSEKEEKDG
ncbi:MAG: hypothetical protein M1819_006533 [Sarea resinae]|nr:MAG: hypothetical protein M1819_006533 [Sarea resinae]